MNDSLALCLTEVVLVEVELQSFLQESDTTAEIARVEKFHPSQKAGLEQTMETLAVRGQRLNNGSKNPVDDVW